MNPDPHSAPRARPIAALAVCCLAVAIAYLGYSVHASDRRVTAELAAVRASNERLEQAVQLLRLEAQTDFSGPRAVVEQISRFAPELASTVTAAPAAQEIRERLELALTSARELGPAAFDALEAAFAAEDEPEARRWLMLACLRADPTRGKQLCADVLRATRHGPDPQTRVRAADALIEVDRELAGEVLATVLRVETAIIHGRPVPAQTAKLYESFVRSSRMPSYFNLIGKLVEAGHPELEAILLEIISRDGYDRMTYQSCVKELATLDSQQAVRRIEKLFERPPFGFVDPLFQNTCLQALADIQGADARPFFERMLTEPQHELVEGKLQALLKQLE